MDFGPRKGKEIERKRERKRERKKKKEKPKRRENQKEFGSRTFSAKKEEV